jgi:hypothetical protein
MVDKNSFFEAIEFASNADNWKPCPRCGGSGQDPTGEYDECYAEFGGCDGVGQLRVDGKDD